MTGTSVVAKKYAARTYYDSSMCLKALECYAEGASDTEMCAELGISWKAFWSWTHTGNPSYHPEFEEAVEYGRMLAEGWWMKKGRDHLQDKTFNYVLWYMNLKNRYGWTDKSDARNNDDAPVQIKLVRFGDEHKQGEIIDVPTAH